MVSNKEMKTGQKAIDWTQDYTNLLREVGEYTDDIYEELLSNEDAQLSVEFKYEKYGDEEESEHHQDALNQSNEQDT